MTKLRALLAWRAIIKTDSQVISGHIEKSFKVGEPKLQKYLQAVRKIEAYFLGIIAKPIPRTEYSEDDELAKATAQSLPLPPDVLYEILHQPSTDIQPKCPKLINTIESANWRAPIIAFHKHQYEPESREEENRMKQRARGYKFIEDNLFKAGVTAPLLKCVTISEGKQILKEIHEGTCSSHNGPRALVGKAFRQGFS